MGGKATFARLKRTNASAVKCSNCCAVHSVVYIEPKETSRGGREQNFPLTNAAGSCRAVGKLPGRETIRRKRKWKGNLIIHLQRQTLVLTQGPAWGRLMWAARAGKWRVLGVPSGGTAGGGCEAGARGAGGWGETHGSPPGKEEVLSLLAMAQGSLSALEGCRLWCFLGVVAPTGWGWPSSCCVPSTTEGYFQALPFLPLLM